jgi:nitroimidazol reductase NimA-like FMN-containing flavoprotein (pyridoxamine 5'-phosphate oxidase superfamily)
VENEIRRKDRMMSDKDAKELLLKGEYGILSTVSPDGQPYGVPLNYSYSGDVIYFHCALEGHKLENIEGSKKVSFCVVGKTEVLPEKFATKYESVIVFGEACEVTGDEKQKGFVELVKKYSLGFMQEGLEYIKNAGSKARVYKIALASITGKARR